MIYLNNTDMTTIDEALGILLDHYEELTSEEKRKTDGLKNLFTASLEYTAERRAKAIEIINKNRKIDKSYAHSKNRKKHS